MEFESLKIPLKSQGCKNSEKMHPFAPFCEQTKSYPKNRKVSENRGAKTYEEFQSRHVEKALYISVSRRRNTINPPLYGTDLLYQNLLIDVAGEEGIEPPLTVLETAVMPLDHSPIFTCKFKTVNLQIELYSYLNKAFFILLTAKSLYHNAINLSIKI